MMDEQQFDTANEQPAGQPDDALSTRDIVSAGQTSRAPDARDDNAPDNRAARHNRRADEYAADAGVAAPSGRRDRDHMSAQDERDERDNRGAVADDDRSATHTDRRDEPSPAPLLSSEATGAYRARWDAIQTAFVDEPRRVVEQADSLVAEVMQRLAETFARERASLEHHWDQGGDVSTEDLRLALQRYRSFFQRLLST